MPEPTAKQTDHRFRAGFLAARQHLGLYRYSVAHYLIGLIVIIVTAPLVAVLDHGPMIETVLMTILLGSGVVAVGERRRARIGAIFLIVPVLIGRWLDHLAPGLMPSWVFMALTVVFLVYLLGHLLRYILRAPRVNSEVLCAGVATYLTLGIAFGILFNLIEQLAPGSFSPVNGPAAASAVRGFNAIYFSFITLATVGYGDIAPVTPTARMLAIVESMIGTFYMAILVARLVALYASGKPPAP